MSRILHFGITFMDIVLGVVFALLGTYLVGLGEVRVPGAQVEIRSARGQVLTFALGEARTVSMEGTRGETVVAIGDGCVHFISSPCPHRVCLKRGRISRCGEWIACIPNGIVVVITGKRDYDGITP